MKTPEKLSRFIAPMTVAFGFLAVVVTANGQLVTWTGDASDGNRWGTADNWSNDAVPSAGNDYDFGSAGISVLGSSITVNTLTGGPGSELRVRNTGQSLTGDLILNGQLSPTASRSRIRFVESGNNTRDFTVNGSTTLNHFVQLTTDEADDVLELDLDSLIFGAGGLYEKQGSGGVILNATSLTANGNTFEVDSGNMIFGGAADYSGLSVDVTEAAASANLEIANTISLAALTLDGNVIAPGTYAPGDTLYTTYSSSITNSGGTLTVVPEPSSFAFLLGGLAGVMMLVRRRRC